MGGEGRGGEGGIICQGCGGGGGPSGCPSLSPGNHSQPPRPPSQPHPPFTAFTHSVTHSLISQSLSLFLSLSLTGFSGHPLSHDSLWIHWEAQAKKKTNKKKTRGDRSEQKEKGDKLKTGQSLKLCSPLVFLPLPPSPASLCYVICLLPLSSDPPRPPLPPVAPAVTHYLYCFLSNKRIDQCHSQCFCCLGSISLMQRAPLGCRPAGVGWGFGGGGLTRPGSH